MARFVALLVGINAALGIATWFGVKFSVRKLKKTITGEDDP